MLILNVYITVFIFKSITIESLSSFIKYKLP